MTEAILDGVPGTRLASQHQRNTATAAHHGSPFRRGRIARNWNKATSTRPPVEIDGETDENGNAVPTVKTLPWCAHYTPQPGDLVLIAVYNHGMIIFDRIEGAEDQ